MNRVLDMKKLVSSLFSLSLFFAFLLFFQDKLPAKSVAQPIRQDVGEILFLSPQN